MPGVPPLDLETDRRIPAGHRAARRSRKDRGTARAVSAELQADIRIAGLSRSRCSRAFRTIPVAVELRHRSWSDDFSATLSLLNSHNAALTQIDEPKFKVSIRQNQLPNITGFYYMRLHGRNAAQWWKHDKSEDRYNYLYSADELKPFAGDRRRSAPAGQEVLSVLQQPLRLESRRERGDDQETARRADPRGVSEGVRRRAILKPRSIVSTEPSPQLRARVTVDKSRRAR